MGILDSPGLTAAAGDARYASIPTVVPKTARQILYSTDMDTDPGDLGAARIVMYYEKAGFFDVLAVGVDRNTPTGAAVTEAFCRSAGRVFQIGQVGSDYMPQTTVSPTIWHDAVLAAASTSAVRRSSDQYPDAVKLWRHALANATGPVDIVCVGSLAVVYGLMQSTADSISALTGAQLIAAKAGHLWIMGGTYPTGTEHNFQVGPVAASNVAANWQTMVGWNSSKPPCITFLGYEAGDTVIAHTNIMRDVPVSDLLLRGMAEYNVRQGFGPEAGRPAWDELLIRVAALGDYATGPAAAGYSRTRGTNVVNSSTGTNTFTNGGSGPHQFLVKTLTDAQYATAIDAIDILGQEPVPGNARWRQTIVTTSVPVLDPSLAPAKPQGFEIQGGFNAADAPLFGAIDGGVVSTLPSRYGVNAPTWIQGNTTKKPTYRANFGGRTVTASGSSAAFTVAGSAGAFSQGEVGLAISGTNVGSNNKILSVSSDGSTATLAVANTGSVTSVTLGGLPCLQFAGGQVLTSGKNIALGTDFTIIVRALFGSVPAAVNTLAAADIGTRVWQLKTDTTGKLQAINFTGGTGRTDTSAALIVANRWQHYIMRYDSTTLEALIDTTGDGALTTTAPNTTTRSIAFGARTNNLEEPMTGYIASAKLIKGKAANADITALIQNM